MNSKSSMESKVESFLSTFPYFLKEIMEGIKKYDPEGKGAHMEQVLSYNVLGGKTLRAIAMIQAYEEIAPKSALTKENLKLANYLAWNIELIQTFFVIVDDIVDGSTTRRGKPCWYKTVDGHVSAVNDAIMVKACIYRILKDHFRHLDCYMELWELFMDSVYVSSLGEYMDTRTKYQNVHDFSMEKYRILATNKTSFYTFYLPVAAAMRLAGIKEEEQFERIKEVLFEIGIFYQAQDDYLDCYGDPNVTGKIGTDIQGGKCTWLVVAFLERASEEQKALLKENYGKSDETSVQRVKKLYEELSLKEVFAKYEEETYQTLKGRIETTEGLPTKLCLNLMDKIYRSSGYFK